MNHAEKYVNEIISYISADEHTLKRLSDDLISYIYEASAGGDMKDTIYRMGSPKDMAQELMDSLYQEKSDVVRELVKTKAVMQNQKRHLHYEYKSKIHIGKLPLIHINRSNGSFSCRVAKGIIAIGDISIGVISVGVFALGGISFGSLSAGLVSLGGLSAGLLLALGGVAIGSVAFGGLAIGAFAFGGCAIASHIAIGGYASAKAAIGGTAKGLYTISTGGTSFNFNQVTSSDVRALLLQAHPNLPAFVIKAISSIFA